MVNIAENRSEARFTFMQIARRCVGLVWDGTETRLRCRRVRSNVRGGWYVHDALLFLETRPRLCRHFVVIKLEPVTVSLRAVP